jgi:4-amino-4-deoxy-L-arabinose transferase-like glycosyltransferase
MDLSRRVVAGLVGLLLVVLLVEVVSTIRTQSLTWDEGDHIFAGYESWKTKDFGLNPEHPPMVKMLATIPLLGLDLKSVPLQNRFFKTEAYLDGRELLFHNAPRYNADSLIFRVRLLPVIFVLALALMVFFAGREMFGWGAGLIGMTLFCFDPNMIAHGGYVTTDMAMTCWTFGTVYAFYRYAKQPTAWRLVLTGLAAGLALASKHSAILLLPMLVCLALAEIAFRWKEEGEEGESRGHRTLRMAGALVVVVVIGVAFLWATYGFRYAARPAGLRLDPSLAEYVMPLKPIEQRGIMLFARFHVLPESWLYGLADVRSMANGMPSYIFGKVYAHGVWFYFPAVFVIKSTLGFLVLFGLSVWAVATGRLRCRREVFFLVVPAAIYLWVAMGAQLNIGARHLLPFWVFAIVLAAGGAWALVERSRAWAWTVAALLLVHVGSSLMAWPNYIAYSNEAWGGPSQTYRYLTDSNTDWGQQLKATRAYVDEHGIKECWIAYFVSPFVLPEDYGIPCKLLPTPDTWFVDEQVPVPAEIHGPVFLSAGDLNGFEFGASALNLYEAFRGVKPTAYIQDGMFVFQGDFAIPQASALSHTQQVAVLLKAKKVDEALVEAQAAEALTPGELRAEIAMGDALAAAGRKDEAKEHYQRALTAARALTGGASAEWVEKVQKKMSTA